MVAVSSHTSERARAGIACMRIWGHAAHTGLGYIAQCDRFRTSWVGWPAEWRAVRHVVVGPRGGPRIR